MGLQAKLQSMYIGFKTLFNKQYAETPSDWDKIATLVKSTTETENYSWIGDFPALRKWVGDRVIKAIGLYDYSIKNEKFESTIGIEVDKVEDNNIGMYSSLVQNMGQLAKTFKDELVFALLLAGFTTKCYDGQYFFDTDHPVGDGVVSNFGGGSGTPWFLLNTSSFLKPLIFQERLAPQFTALTKPDDPNVFMQDKYLYGVKTRGNAGYAFWQMAYASKDTLNAANFAAARASMMSLKNDEGKPLGLTPNLLVVPPSLESAAREILMNERTTSGATNQWKGTAELLVSPWLV